MTVTMTFKVEWDRTKEDFTSFREKYDAFREHVEGLQARGTLPRTEARWVISTKKGDVMQLAPPLLGTPAVGKLVGPALTADDVNVVHVAGDVLQ